MAATLKFVRRYELEAGDLDSLDLLGFTAGFSLADNGWLPATGTEDDERVAESITLLARDTSQNNLAFKLHALERCFEERQRWQNSPAQGNAVWLRAKLQNETQERQSLVTRLHAAPRVPLFDKPVYGDNFIREYVLGIERIPWWESVSALVAGVPGLSCHGTPAAVGTVTGTMPARIAMTKFSGVSGKHAVIDAWLGFRTSRFGTPANFVSPWLAEYNEALGDDTEWLIAYGASPSRLVCDFDTEPDLVPRAYFTAHSVSSSNYVDQRGTFDVLALMAVSGEGVSATVRMDAGLYNNVWNVGENVTVDSTSWKYYNLGRVTWPVVGPVTSYASEVMRQSAIRISAARTSVSGSWMLGRIIPIPVDEGYMVASGMYVNYSSSDYERAEIYVSPLGHVVGLQYADTGYVADIIDTRGTSLKTYGLPDTADSIAVLAANAYTFGLDDTLDVNLHCLARWRTLRGLY